MSDDASTISTTPIPPAAKPAGASSAQSFIGHAKLISVLTFASRIMGLLREVVAAHYLGTGVVATAFNVAFAIPNLFRKLFGEGALSAAFIPLYAQSVKNDPIEKANDFAAASVNLLCAILLGITIVGEVILGAMLLFADPKRVDYILMIRFAAIMLPYVLLICGGAFLSGILQVHKRFGAPAAAPIILNVCHIGVVFLGAMFLGLRPHANSPEEFQLQMTLAYWLAFFVLVAGVLQVVVLLPGLRAVGFRFKFVPHFWTPMVKKMLALTLPVALGAGVLQLSVLIDKGISVVFMQGVDTAGNLITHFTLFGHSIRYPLELGAPVRLSAAQLMYQFPLGVFATALATAIFPALSANALDADRGKFRSVLRHGIEATFWEGLPASLGLILVAEPAVRLLFQHGEITPHDSTLIARSLMFYAGAIWAFSLQQILNRAYYAIHDTVTPLVMSVVTLTVNCLVEIPLLWTPLGEAGMAAGTVASFAIQSVVMLYMLDKKIGGLDLRRSITPVLKMLAATLVMGLACWAVKHSPLYPDGQTRAIWLTQLILLITTGAVVYLTTCALLGISFKNQLRPRAD